MVHLKRWPLIFAGGFFWVTAAVAEDPNAAIMPASGVSHRMHDAATCTEPELKCATSVTPVFSGDGRLWLAWAAGGTVSVAFSTDQGRNFSSPVVVGPRADRLDAGSESRPQLLIDKQGRMTVAWSVFKDDKYNAQVYLSTSQDDGAHFSEPRPLADNPVSQRFPMFAADDDGNIFAAWIDKRNAGTGADGKKLPGAALAFAWSRDGGNSFAPVQIADQPACECCRLGLAMGNDGKPVIVYRKLFEGGIRDHAVLTFDKDKPGRILRVADDAWAINGCPHHGPALAVMDDGSYHVAWFTQGAKRQGAFYAYKKAGATGFSTPLPIGAAGKMAGRSYLLANGNKLWLVWKEVVEKQTTVYAQMSGDRGRHWSKARMIAETSAYSDHPILINNAGQTWLSWFTRNEGYRLIALQKK
ncbi:sialidase family protein [Candidatus Methylospira mobilis]|uniref:sialidase family protein n=1 Tax=Candidatus Methylospira mobilis TaxID=1808979 RepID=UPI0028F11541|nr:sialidase family protein [Candidatus Methylospira mobilis]WNV06776.1 sialidase family protein [Candidatus Methylospira mobilis]